MAEAWQPEEAGFHITLRFLGDMTREQLARFQLIDYLKESTPEALGLRAFELKLGAVDVFCNDRGSPRVLCAPVVGDKFTLYSLRGLARGRAGAIGSPLPPADFPFNPHITLGRFNRDLTPEESRHLEDALRRFDGRLNVLVAIFHLTWTVTGACIMESVRTRSCVEYRIVTDQHPEHGWCCFHCGDIFTTYGEAYMHFGLRPTSPPACRLDRGVLIDLRAAEDRVAELEDRVAELEEALGELQG